MPRDTSSTRAALLAAARGEFAAHGIAGARVDRIAEAAGVNKERIYGHFGSKEKLFDAVMEEVLAEVLRLVSPPAPAPRSGEGEQEPGKDAGEGTAPGPGRIAGVGDIGDYVARIYDHHRGNPELMRLILWEALHYGGAREASARRHGHYRAKLEALAAALGREADAEVGRVLLTVCGLGVWPSAVPQLADLVLGPEAAADSDAMRAHVVAVARAAFGPGQGHGRESGGT
ncbi:TetR/AcrR family transcriptional regulator [Streptomyces hoynatensis]|uniref:TetR/AcrR family transcriptional regulator n=1 Tax=Streptomyces hoynatensis TaxID=1141874 RepID=A0A3A9Z8R4_9ACTN|nr:TetR family transcriptional regulator [Streptomyces hoynatensis]RKN44872.1 TetR/AcrR family transcriptional regulator [Streptomyces hoynatensis]